MPSVTADTLNLPRPAEPAAGAIDRSWWRASPRRALGFEAMASPPGGPLPVCPRKPLDPFVHTWTNGAGGVLARASPGTYWHPHRGPSMTRDVHLDRPFQHQDSHAAAAS